jgi:hypothetical protein
LRNPSTAFHDWFSRRLGQVSDPTALPIIFVVYVPDLADAVTKAAPWAVYGLVLPGCMYAMPRGIAGLVHALWRRVSPS